MTTILVANLITAIVAVSALTIVCRLGFRAGGGRYDRRLRRLELRRTSPELAASERRAA